MNLYNIKINKYYIILLLISSSFVGNLISAKNTKKTEKNNYYKNWVLPITGSIFASAGIASLPTPYNYKEYQTKTFFSDHFREYVWWEKDSKRNFNLHINLISGICSFYLAYKIFQAAK